jgi:TPP-dependent pyruvate/acetoin dehydrogenase alpha subunit
MTSQELIDFECEIADLFEQGKIRAPIHLSKGNEEDLIRIFKQIKSTDWVCSTHRSHYHALLKGISKEWLKNEILQGRSITICSREHRFITSAIVGGILPIALGLAMAGRTVWCFVGDMASETGIFHECVKYATGHKLPIVFVVEDNGLSVDTPTDKVWRYSYTREFPHTGMGRFVEFG